MCVESGMLEYKSACSILSFRSNAGPWKNARIHAYSPRPGHRPSLWMREFLARHDVEHIALDLNTRLPDYPLANKPVCMAHAEEVLPEATLVFLDGDTICWNPPNGLALPDSADLMLWPDSTKTVASSGPGDHYDPMWLKLYQIAGAVFEPWTTTQLTGARVRGWWSSGVVVVRRSSGLMRAWRETLFRAIEKDVFPKEATYLREQLCLSGVAATTDRIAPLSVGCNYPVQNWDHYTKQDGIAPESAEIWHYQEFLNRAFRRFAGQMAAAPSLEKKISTTNAFLAHVKSDYRSWVGRDEPIQKALRRRLKLGIRLRRLLGIPRDTDTQAADF